MYFLNEWLRAIFSAPGKSHDRIFCNEWQEGGEVIFTACSLSFLHFIFNYYRCYSAAAGPEEGMSLPYQHRSPLSPIGQTTKSDHIPTWHCCNEAVGWREYKKTLHVLHCSFFLALRDSKKRPGAAQHLGPVITSEAARKKSMRSMVGYHFLRSLLYLQVINYCKILNKTRYHFFLQQYTRGCMWVKPSFSSLWLVFA